MSNRTEIRTDGPCTVVSDYDGLVCTAQAWKTPKKCEPLREDLYAAAAGKDEAFAWRRDQSLGSRRAEDDRLAPVRGQVRGGPAA